MTNVSWPLANFASRLLEPSESEAVLGDLVEAGDTGWRALRDVSGLILLRHALIFRTLRPWLVGFGLALPASFLLTWVSFSVSSTFERIFGLAKVDAHWWPTGHEGLFLWSCHILLLIAWSWIAGFLCASLSRRSLLFSVALCLAPFFFYDFRIGPLPKPCLLLFVLPMLLGIFHSLQGIRIAPAFALLLALGMTGLMAFCWTNEALWILNWALLIPTWSLVAVSVISDGRAKRHGLA